MKLKSALGLIVLLLSSNVFAKLDASLEYEVIWSKDVHHSRGEMVSLDCADGSYISAIINYPSSVSQIYIQSSDSVSYKSYFYLAIKDITDVSSNRGYVDVVDSATHIRVISYPISNRTQTRQKALLIDRQARIALLHEYNESGELLQKIVCEDYKKTDDWNNH